MKKTLMVLFCLSMGLTVFALPISLRGGVNFGKFYEGSSSNGKAFQYQSGLIGGQGLLIGANLLLEYYKYDEIPGGIMIPEYRVVSKDKHQYAYGGSVTIGLGKQAGPHLVYRFKKVRTYYKVVLEDFINDPGDYWTESDFREQPAYDIAVGFHGKWPGTNIFMVGEFTIISKIWDVERNIITIGLGYEMNLGNMCKGMKK